MIMVYVWFVEATVTYGKWMMDTGCQKGEVLNFLKLSCIQYNKMQDLILKTTFIIVRIVFKPKNNDV